MRSAERQWWVQHQSAAERGLFAFYRPLCMRNVGGAVSTSPVHEQAKPDSVGEFLERGGGRKSDSLG
jgi:hypothetical protein